jgi:hypothetical protein
MSSLSPVTFTPEPSGRVQLARTGSGFWRHNHGAAFAIDKELLAQMLYNTQLRKRPVRMDFMHYANGKEGMPIEALGAAGCIDPADITLEPWTEPSTGAAGFGLFAPNSWKEAGWKAVQDGVDEISPVIAWEFVLSEDAIDPATGEVIPAGTMIGPTITGVSLVDRGFFWMDKVQLYSEAGSTRASLYQETVMALALEKLQTLIAQLIKTGFTQEEAAPILAAAMAAESKKEEPKPADPAMPAKEAASAPAAPAVLAARMPNTTAAATTKTLAELWTEAKKAAKPTDGVNPQAYSEQLAELDTRLSRIEASHDELMLSDLERQGLLRNIPDARRLYKEAPAYFAEQVAKVTPLTGASPAGAAKASGLRAIANNAGLSAEDKFAQEVKLYREDCAAKGRKITQQQAIEEVEAAQKARS